MAQHTASVDIRKSRAWAERGRVVLTPVAAPAILGWFCFAAAAFLFGSHLAGWWGGAEAMLYLAPFLGLLGLAQLLAGMWGFRAREPMATVAHGAWGAFWLAIGFAHLFVAIGWLTAEALMMPFGMALLAMALVTIGPTIAATFENVFLTVLLGAVTLTGILTSTGMMAEVGWLSTLGGWLFVLTAVLGWYFATAILTAETTGEVRLPIGRYRMAADVPGEPMPDPVAYNTGFPLAELESFEDTRREPEPAG